VYCWCCVIGLLCWLVLSVLCVAIRGFFGVHKKNYEEPSERRKRTLC
jgi:hypothetical protein